MQLTPPGSESSIIIGKGITSAVPGSLQGLHLVVFDVSDGNGWFLQEVRQRAPGR